MALMFRNRWRLDNLNDTTTWPLEEVAYLGMRTNGQVTDTNGPFWNLLLDTDSAHINLDHSFNNLGVNGLEISLDNGRTWQRMDGLINQQFVRDNFPSNWKYIFDEDRNFFNYSERIYYSHDYGMIVDVNKIVNLVGYGLGVYSNSSSSISAIYRAGNITRPFYASFDRTHSENTDFLEAIASLPFFNSTVVGETAPTSSRVGDQWFNPTTGRLYIYTE